MPDIREDTEEFLEERPELEAELREILDVDGEGRPWNFDDVPLDSGQFGELVSRGIVDNQGDGYRVADREAVIAALDGNPVHPDGDPEATPDGSLTGLDMDAGNLSPAIDRRVAVALAGALGLVGLFRIVSFTGVFRGGDIVLPLNDPYYYRYWVDRLAAQAAGPFDIGILSSLPRGVAMGEPAMVTTMWWFAELLGGSQWASGMVLAVYPVVASIGTGGFVYLVAKEVTDDPRVGIASVVMLAVTPFHAFRTSLGFGDHHAFDYLWLSMTAAALVYVVGTDREFGDPKLWGAVTMLGVGVGIQTLAWEAAPLLLIPVGVVATLTAVVDVRNDRSPAWTGAPVTAGVVLGAVIVLGAHLGFGWHGEVVAFSPALLAGGIAGVTLLGAAVHRSGASPRVRAGLLAAGFLTAGVVVSSVLPEFGVTLADEIDFLVSTEGIVETRSLVAGQFGVFFGPVLGFGPVLVLGLPYLLWGSLRIYRESGRRWLVVGVYAWYFLALSLVQNRFAGQLALFGAVFAGLGFVHLAAWLDMVRPPRLFLDAGGGATPTSVGVDDANGGSDNDDVPFTWPERRTLANLVILGLFVCSLGVVMTPVYQTQGTYSKAQFGAAQQARSYSVTHDLSYPDNYVLSQWDETRMYNYFVNGESESYAYARGTYDPSRTDVDAEEWYERIRNRVGFLVVSRAEDPSNPLFRKLLDGYGNQGDTNRSGLAHYRVIWKSDSGTHVLVRLVPGATINGRGPPSSEVSVSASVEIGDRTVDYERRVRTDANGTFSVTVPYPGRYTVGDGVVEVPETAVENGTSLSVGNVSGVVTTPVTPVVRPAPPGPGSSRSGPPGPESARPG